MNLLNGFYNLLVPKNKLLILFIIVILLLALGLIFRVIDERDSDSDSDSDDCGEIEGMENADDDPVLGDALELRKKEESILPNGPRGETGLRGKKGEQGTQGKKGEKGSRGNQGEQGDQGEQGEQGNKGDKGDKGERGKQGPVGPVDERAYNIAMDTKSELADLEARAAAAEATAAAALQKASMPPRLPTPSRRRRRRRWWSDKRLKTNVKQLGISEMGIPIYSYNYIEIMDGIDEINVEETYKGVMAQDLLELGYDNAVLKMSNGYYSVNYNKIDVNFEIL
jgi:hypothetical protein